MRKHSYSTYLPEPIATTTPVFLYIPSAMDLLTSLLRVNALDTFFTRDVVFSLWHG